MGILFLLLTGAIGAGYVVQKKRADEAAAIAAAQAAAAQAAAAQAASEADQNDRFPNMRKLSQFSTHSYGASYDGAGNYHRK